MKPHRFRLAGLGAVLVLALTLISARSVGSAAPMIPSPSATAMLRAKQVMVGYGDGDMRWGNTITRAESVKLLLAAIGEVAPSLTRSPLAFVDVLRSHWAFSHITMAAEMGLVRGRPNNVFDPEQGVTMAEFMVMVSRVYVGLGSEAGAPNPRLRVSPSWAAPEIIGWPDLTELVAGNSEAIDLDYPASRGEVGTLAARMMERLGVAYDIGGLLADYASSTRLISLTLAEGAGAVEIPVSEKPLWFSGDNAVDPSKVIGRRVQIVFDDSGRASVIVTGLK